MHAPHLAALVCFATLLGCCGPDRASTATPTATGSHRDTSTNATTITSPTHDPTRPTMPAADAPSPSRVVATFGGGCFWCTEAVLEQLDGVLDVVSGYAGGHVEAPTYEQVCSGATGHAEVVQVTFDPGRISLATIYDWFLKSHDPTTLNRQGPDEGTQYRSAIFVHDDAQKAAATAAIARAQQRFADPIVTEVTPLTKFWPAEAYHQDYFRNNPGKGYCRAMIAPKLEKLGLDPRPK